MTDITSSIVTLNRDTLLDNGIFGLEGMDARTQPFNLLRTQLLRKLAPSGGRIIAVTSTQPHNGKSFVATNLAAALSQIEPTILVDLDLRQPDVGRRFGLPECAGADDFLRSRLSLAQVSCVMAEHKLKIIPVRAAHENSADLLSSPRADALFAALRQALGSPVCIIDTPPILEGDDMLIIARHVDGVLMVVEEGQTSQHELSEALRMLRPTPLLGTILNRSVSRTVTSSYYRYSNYRRAVEPTIETVTGAGAK
jgi:protein-tyrosine kinase